VNEVIALLLVLLLATSGYAAGRLHGQLGYKNGYRFGYRQGYHDGDRASWNRRRRELQAAVASVLKTPPALRTEAYPATKPAGTTYTSTTYDDPDNELDSEPANEPDNEPDDGANGRHSRNDWALVDAGTDT
jgi:hypothetical protein